MSLIASEISATLSNSTLLNNGTALLNNGTALARTGISDFSDITLRQDFPYRSFVWDSNQITSHGSFTLNHNYSVDALCHQAVLNEIATRPSNFGLGMGVALKKLFEHLKGISKKIKGAEKTKGISLQQAAATSDEVPSEAEQMVTAIEPCLEATDTLTQRLMAVERAEDLQEDCLVRSGLTRGEARDIQFLQQPIGYRPHEQSWNSVTYAAYRVRRNECPAETEELLSSVRAAESAEKEQRIACDGEAMSGSVKPKHY